MTMTTTTKKKNSEVSTPLPIILSNSVWEWHEWNFRGKGEVKILNVSDSNKDELWLRDQGYEKVTTISPNNIENLDCGREYHIAICHYLNKQLKDYDDREDFLFDLGQIMHPVGAIFVSVSNKSGIQLECNIVEETKAFTTYVL